MDVVQMKKDQIYKVFSDPNLVKDNKVKEINRILKMDNQEFMREYYSNERKKIIANEIYETYKCLFNVKGINYENKKD